MVAVAAIPLPVSVCTNRPIAARATGDAATTTAIGTGRRSPSANGIGTPEILVTSPSGKNNAPPASADSATTSVAAGQKAQTAVHLASGGRVAPGRRGPVRDARCTRRPAACDQPGVADRAGRLR
ncbi:hypothetical protein GCM10010381_56420 [Streptomyces xantholiticus]|nr:hypothetical protein GCM10010381_56420 [Streptomyces xantholiticus]